MECFLCILLIWVRVLATVDVTTEAMKAHKEEGLGHAQNQTASYELEQCTLAAALAALSQRSNTSQHQQVINALAEV